MSNPQTKPARAVFIADARSGQLFTPVDHRRILTLKPTTTLKIYNTTPPQARQQKTVSFTCSAWSDGLMATGDQRGSVCVFDVARNRWWSVVRLGVSVSCLSFGITRKREVVVALADHTLVCYDVDSCSIVAKLGHYHSNVCLFISMHPSRSLMITTSCTEVRFVF